MTVAINIVGLPKTVTGLQRAILMNNQIADASKGYWRKYHKARAAACEQKLDGRFGGLV